jgi:hypothetical protein
MAGLTRRAFTLALAAGAGGLTACGAQSLSADPQVIANTDAAFQEMAAGNEKALLARLPQAISADPGQVRMIRALREFLPKAKAKPYELVGWHSFAGTGGRQHDVVLRYTYDNGEHITATALFIKSRPDEPWKMMSLNVKPSSPDEVAAPVISPTLFEGKTEKKGS